jgi:hypothetical protein
VTRRRTRRLAAALVLGCLLALGVDQAVLYAALDDDLVLGQRLAPFDPPYFTAAQRAALARIEQQVRTGEPPAELLGFHAELGWAHAPESGAEDFVFDRFGARVGVAPLAAQKPAGVTRVAAFGCSFTIGVQVGPLKCWPAALDALSPGVEVANLGVAGYGLDQAFLRWRLTHDALDCDEVLLGFLPAAATRNLSVYRPALRHWSETLAFKPRFVLALDGELELVPNPARSFAELARLVRTQSELHAVLARTDGWVQRAPAAWAPRGSHWSHWFATGRLALTLLERRGRDPAAALADASSETYRVTRAIALAMAREVQHSGARFRLLVLPDRPALRSAASGRPYWASFAADVNEAGVELLDLSPALLAAGALDDDAFWLADGHYAPGAHAVVARALAQRE